MEWPLQKESYVKINQGKGHLLILLFKQYKMIVYGIEMLIKMIKTTGDSVL